MSRQRKRLKPNSDTREGATAGTTHIVGRVCTKKKLGRNLFFLEVEVPQGVQGQHPQRFQVVVDGSTFQGGMEVRRDPYAHPLIHPAPTGFSIETNACK